ncbi:hypothetical protein GCM10022221_57610 [Actinocorallia aurea]
MALFSALLFYFGWVRTKVEADALGYDVTVLGLGTQDYLLRSIAVLSPLLLLLVLLALVLHWIHLRWIAPLGPAAAGRFLLAFRVAAVLATAGAVLLLAGPLGTVALPLALTLGALSAVYHDRLRRLADGEAGWTASMRVLVLALLVIAVFWDVERVARFMGTAYADDIAARPEQFAAVTLYSAKDLRLSDVTGVTETRIKVKDSAYKYRYSGLRLLQRAPDRFILINDRWQPVTGRVILLKDADGFRVELSCSEAADRICSGTGL